MQFSGKMVTCIHAREEMPKQKTPPDGLQTAGKKGGVKVLEVEQQFLLDNNKQTNHNIATMKYQMQVQIEETKEGKTSLVWKSVKASHSTTPYEYDTKEEAERMLRAGYGAAVSNDRLRVIEVE